MPTDDSPPPSSDGYVPPPEEVRRAKQDLFRQIREQAEAAGKVKPKPPAPEPAPAPPPPPPKKKFKLRAQPPAAAVARVESSPEKESTPSAEREAGVKASAADARPPSAEPKEAPSAKALTPAPEKEPAPKVDASAEKADPSDPSDQTDPTDPTEPAAPEDHWLYRHVDREKLQRLWDKIGGGSLMLSVGIHALLLISAVFIVFRFTSNDRVDFLPGSGTKQGQEASQALENKVNRKKNQWLTRKQPLARIAVNNAMADIQLPDMQPDLVNLPGPESFMKAGGGMGGGLGMGSMNGATFKPMMLFGTQIMSRKLAVVLDVSASMTPYLEQVVNEVDKVARGSPVILYYGCGLDRREPGMKVDETVRRTQSSAFEKFWREWQQTDPTLVGTSKGSIPKGQLYNFFVRRNNTYFIDYNGVGFAWLALLADEIREADGVYWFSDFEDQVQEKQMGIVLENMKRRKQRLYIHPQIKGTFLDPITINLVWPTGGKVIDAGEHATRKQ